MMQDSMVLEAIQRDLPPTNQPFHSIAKELGTTEDELVRAVNRLQEDGLIREVSAILDATRLGFHSSLVALRLFAQDVESVAATISANPRVSHNYQRDHEYNLWFTIAAPRDLSIDEAVARLLVGCVEEQDVLLLPAVRTYKLRVHLPPDGFGEHAPSSNPRPVEPVAHPSESSHLTDEERRVLAVLERPLPIVADFWAEAARRAHVDEANLMEMVGRWRADGTIRRVSGVVRHRRIGYAWNGMACYAVPPERADDAGALVSARPYVSHCYYRDAGGKWAHPLFAMIHAKDKSVCEDRAKAIATDLGHPDCMLLFSSREFKKERVRYFEGEL